jgi:hypothetical protein
MHGFPAEAATTGLEMVRQLAARVANSTHVLEAVGGISARYLADTSSAERALDYFSVVLTASAGVRITARRAASGLLGLLHPLRPVFQHIVLDRLCCQDCQARSAPHLAQVDAMLAQFLAVQFRVVCGKLCRCWPVEQSLWGLWRQTSRESCWRGQGGGSVVWPAFPQPLVQLLGRIMADGGAPARLWIKAHSLGAEAVALVEGDLRDSQQALLWSAAWAEVAHICLTSVPFMFTCPCEERGLIAACCARCSCLPPFATCRGAF